MNSSKYLLRSNVALTSNVKLVVDTNYNLYLESYSANKELSDNQYKKQQINSNAFLSERIASFWNGIPSSLAFQVRNDIKSDTIQNNLNNQYDDLYYSGMRQVEDTRYEEEFQYNTTLKIESAALPKGFLIFRVDEPGNVKNPANTTIGSFVKNELKSKFKVVKYFNLTNETALGQLWKKNYIDDDVLPRSPFELNIKKYEFSKWNGYDYKTGGSVTKSLFIDDFFRNQTTHFEMEKFITEGFQKNDVISSNYSNVSFLFNDTVCSVIKKYDGTSNTEYDIDTYTFLHDYIAEGIVKSTEYSLVTLSNITYFRANVDISYKKRWSINRYYGFYLDNLDQITRVSPYSQVKFQQNSNIEIVNNEFLLGGVGGNPIDPTLNGWTQDVPIYIKIYKDYYLIEKNNLGQYVIVSNILWNFNASTSQSLVDLLDTAELPIKIDYVAANFSTCGYNYVNLLSYIDGTQYHVYEHVLSTDLTRNGYVISEDRKDSVHLIKINNIYYHIEYVEYLPSYFRWIIVTDEVLTCNGSQLIRKHDENKTAITNTQVLTKNDSIIFFNIYVAQFTEIGDWDFRRDVTDYAKIEYDIDDQVPYNRPFLHEINYLDTSLIKDIYEERSFQINTKYNKVNSGAYQIFPTVVTDFTMPISSEYGACGDLYMLSNKYSDISSIWNINQSTVKWGWYESQSNCSYPYKINNSLEKSGIWNFSPNSNTIIKNSQEFSHDWFYTVGPPVIHSSITDLSNIALFDTNWTYYTLNIQQPFDIGAITNNVKEIFENYYKFNIDYYIDPVSTFDVFKWFLNTPLNIITKSTVAFTPGQPLRDTLIDNINRTSKFSKSDNVNGPQVLFRGFNAYIEWVDLPNPTIIKDIKTRVANDLEDYSFAIIADTKEEVEVITTVDPFTSTVLTFPNVNIGNCGIDIIINKKHKNVLIFIYIVVPYKSITSLQYNNRDNAMLDDFVTYSYYSSQTSVWTTEQSKLNLNSLTLNRLYSILNNPGLPQNDFNLGVNYKVIDDTEEWTVNQSATNYSAVYNISDDITTFTIQLNSYLKLKQGDWFYLKGTIIPEGNYQISNILANNTLQFIRNSNYSSVALSGFANAIITKQVSLLPFRFRCIRPDSVAIDINANVVSSDISCPVQPENRLKSINNVLIYDRLLDNGLVNNVWIDTPINRVLNRSDRTKDLSYNEINKLPIINRFSGDYSPIINEMNLFERPTLDIMNVDDSGAANDSLTTYYTDVFNGKYHLILKYTDTVSNLLCGIKAGDIVYLHDPFTPVTRPDFHTQLVEVIAIKSKVFLGGVFVYDIVTSKTFSSNAYPSTTIRPSLLAYFFHQTKDRTKFKFNNKSFGLNKGVIVAKEWISNSISPLKTSNPVYNVKNKWAMIDEHGVTVIDKNIFQSSWDPEFYFETNKNIYNNY